MMNAGIGRAVIGSLKRELMRQFLCVWSSQLLQELAPPQWTIARRLNYPNRSPFWSWSASPSYFSALFWARLYLVGWRKALIGWIALRYRPRLDFGVPMTRGLATCRGSESFSQRAPKIVPFLPSSRLCCVSASFSKENLLIRIISEWQFLTAFGETSFTDASCSLSWHSSSLSTTDPSSSFTRLVCAFRFFNFIFNAPISRLIPVQLALKLSAIVSHP